MSIFSWLLPKSAFKKAADKPPQSLTEQYAVSLYQTLCDAIPEMDSEQLASRKPYADSTPKLYDNLENLQNWAGTLNNDAASKMGLVLGGLILDRAEEIRAIHRPVYIQVQMAIVNTRDPYLYQLATDLHERYGRVVKSLSNNPGFIPEPMYY